MADPVSRVSRVLMRGPLAPFAEQYRFELLARGYTPLTAVNQLQQVAPPVQCCMPVLLP